MTVIIPDFLLDRSRRAFGAGAGLWIEALSERLAYVERAWHLTVLPPFSTGNTCSWVGPVRRALGSPAVLKINHPDEPESRCEADALRLIGGRGAVRLLCATEGGQCLLMERCVPGVDVWSLPAEEGNEVGAGILSQIWREAGTGFPFDPVSSLVEEWRQTLPEQSAALGYDPTMVDTAMTLALDLEQSTPRSVLLHGDFHPGNVLSAGRARWLAIDPKPLVGDPSYDLAQWIGNRCEALEGSGDPIGTICRQIQCMSQLLELDPVRVAGWAFVKSIAWNWGPEIARLLWNCRQCVLSRRSG